MKKLLAAALLTLSVATPAQAQDAFASQDAKAWGRAIGEAGITLEKAAHCPPRELASYTTRGRTIWICPLALTKQAPSIFETVGHELVHAIQHCAGRLEGSNRMMPISHYLHKNGETAVAARFLRNVMEETQTKTAEVNVSIDLGSSKSTPLTHEVLEREAYALEDEPDLVMELLPIFCGG